MDGAPRACWYRCGCNTMIHTRCRCKHQSCNTEHSTKAKHRHYGISAHHEAEVLRLGDTSFKHVQGDLSCHDQQLVALDGSIHISGLMVFSLGKQAIVPGEGLHARCGTEDTCTTSKQNQPAKHMHRLSKSQGWLELQHTKHSQPAEKAACTIACRIH